MSKVYFMPVTAGLPVSGLAAAARRLLAEFVAAEGVVLAPELPLKVHFGEHGNRTYLRPETYDGLIDFIVEQGSKCFFVETSVLYGGRRYERAAHLKLAEDHGFTRIPVVIADGERGEDAYNVNVNLKHYRSCSLGAGFAAYDQVLVLSHFKGHMLAGFGGAVKQLSMGFASKGGKMAMHMGVKPRIRRWLCRRCGLCVKRCQVAAITLGGKPHIDHDVCIGCGACFSACPHHAVSILSLAGLRNALFGGRIFREKLVEYACAAHRGRRNIYLNFAVNVTRGCDCEPLPMRPVIPDIGIFVSSDPVAADAACFEAAAAAGRRFKGVEQLAYAEKIGMGSVAHEMVVIAP